MRNDESNDNMFQRIFDALIDFLPENWTKLVYTAEYYEGSFSMKYYVKTLTSDYVSCYDLKNINNTQIVDIFVKLDKIISADRSQLDEEKRWSAIAMIVDSDGKMHVDFDYSSVTENQIEYEKRWEKKHLV